jgi:hypothetical protein
MGRISVELSDELEKRLRFRTIERFGGRKGDLSRAVEEAVKQWVAEEKIEDPQKSQVRGDSQKEPDYKDYSMARARSH